ncbi:division/cell wall cluster transcriptional repressor MraZ [Capnocytophaga catalasegens]|uniref:Transcriptional regulator MraZ n=1 Tax=Capnocytophaga catalasegens TaxID=1004260 RepID=A0AAV5AY85_9FLAO|nr:division/cell wall cluster transcriptional repressor MraZ [Capnocytophaga catalasegens]GIZ14181.1 transcriptional regulator MraZ [Capnocytophaga catalasegens]GJM50361.1 transcriptional regulator MraZ [Capnocytophaga catalasegens]GJM52643.1 transcriptional regulator MraZ [Capnocytophaga catalasegens]
MITFFETYQCKADAKGRISLPSGLKNILNDVLAEGLVLKRSVFKPCIELYPMSEWKMILEKMSKLSQFNRKNLDFIRRFTADVKVVDVDNAGRFLIPKHLFDFAQLDKDVVLASTITFIEIWDKNLYEQDINSLDETEFMRLTEEIMGNHADELS